MKSHRASGVRRRSCGEYGEVAGLVLPGREPASGGRGLPTAVKPSRDEWLGHDGVLERPPEPDQHQTCKLDSALGRSFELTLWKPADATRIALSRTGPRVALAPFANGRCT